jgi:hypothetical protein
MRNPFSGITRRKIVMGAAVAVVASGGIVAFAYFSAAGSGAGTGTAGSSLPATILQTGITYSNNPINTLVPGTTASVTLTVTNTGTGNQEITAITLTGFSSTSATPDCNSTSIDTIDTPGTESESGWITMPSVGVGQDLAAGATSTPVTGTITFNNEAYLQNVCQGAAITFDYASS